MPARVLNMVVIVDAEFRGEIENRLERVGRYHPSRLVLCAVEPGRTKLDAWAAIGTEDARAAGHIAVGRERVELLVGEQHLAEARHDRRPAAGPRPGDDGVVAARPRRGGRRAAPAGADRADRLPGRAGRRGGAGARRRPRRATPTSSTSSWLRSTPWRERVAAAFDPPRRRPELRAISGVTVRHREDSLAARAAVLRLAGLAAGLEAGRAAPTRAGSWTGHATHAPAGRQDPARAGRPERARARRRDASSWPRARRWRSTAPRAGCARCAATATARSARWTVLGASRGEGGILGEGVRQALLRDPTYRPALTRREADGGIDGASAWWRTRPRPVAELLLEAAAARRPHRADGRLDAAPRVRDGGARGRGLEPARRCGSATSAASRPHDGRSNFAMADERARRPAPGTRGRRCSGWRASSGRTPAPATTRRWCASTWAASRAGTCCCSASAPTRTSRRCSPASPRCEERARLVAGVERRGLEPQVPRITLTLPAFNAARKVVFLVTGADKAHGRCGARSATRPIRRARRAGAPGAGELIVLLDEAAAKGCRGERRVHRGRRRRDEDRRRHARGRQLSDSRLGAHRAGRPGGAGRPARRAIEAVLGAGHARGRHRRPVGRRVRHRPDPAPASTSRSTTCRCASC